MTPLFLLSKIVGVLINPTIHWLILITWILAAVIRGRKPVLTVFTLTAYLLLVLASPVPSWLIRQVEASHSAVKWQSLQPAKRAVVVLGGGFATYNTEIGQYFLSQSSERLIEGARLVKYGHASHLIVSGSTVFSQGHHFIEEAPSAKQLAIELGLKEEQISVEANSMNTIQNAQFSANILNKLGFDNFFLCTSAYHMERSMRQFQKLGLKPTAYPVDFRASYEQQNFWQNIGWKNLQMWSTAIHEIIGRLYYAIR